ncbi:hypothetical protein KUCAC02_023476, partial [Chaenocephalus aceratus]
VSPARSGSRRVRCDSFRWIGPTETTAHRVSAWKYATVRKRRRVHSRKEPNPTSRSYQGMLRRLTRDHTIYRK